MLLVGGAALPCKMELGKLGSFILPPRSTFNT